MTTSVLLLGIGNVLWSDEGFGVRVIEHLQKHYQFPENVRVMDGGTQGLYLVDAIQQADVLILFDAIDYGLKAGEIRCLENDAVPQFLGAKKMSLHQTGFQEVLATAQMLGKYPEHLLLIGVQPEELEDYGGSLSSCVKAQIQPAIDYALEYLKSFNVSATLCEISPILPDPILDIERYEQQRPAENEACRVGDARVLTSPLYELHPPKVLEDVISVDVDYRGQY